MARGMFRKTLLLLVCAAAFILAAAYALGGSAAFRQMRARVRAFMEPPTPAQIQGAVAAERRQALVDSMVRADTAHGPRSDPPASLGFILKLVGVTLGGVIILVVASTRWAGPVSRRISREERI